MARAHEVIFGYTIENDVSDRGGRGDIATVRTGWLANHTIRLRRWDRSSCPKSLLEIRGSSTMKFLLNGQLMQDASTSLMIHDVFEQVSYASNIITLQVGDVIATGSPAASDRRGSRRSSSKQATRRCVPTRESGR